MVGEIQRGDQAKARKKAGGTVKVVATEQKADHGKTQVSFVVKADINKADGACFLTLNRKLPKGGYKPVYKTEGKVK